METKRKISAVSQKIIRHLKKGTSSRKLERMGFSPSTIRYNRYKLFNPTQYRKTLEKIAQYNRNRYAKRKKSK